MLDLLAFVVVAVGLATPFVVPLMWGQLENPESETSVLPGYPRTEVLNPAGASSGE